MNTFDLTPEQEKAVEDLVAQGWPRSVAEVMVVESTEDVLEQGDDPNAPIGAPLSPQSPPRLE